MSIELFTALMFGAFFVLLGIGVPLGFALGGLAVVFGYILQGSTIFPWLIFRTWDIITLYSFIAIPMFIFMANMLRYSGISDDLYHAVHVWLGPVRGGLAIATVAACTLLAAMVGTAGAGVVVMGLIALPFMLQRGYDKNLACGSVMAGGSLGVLIPPSVVFILYGLFAGESIGKLFIGGLIPGLVLAALFSLYILIKCWVQPEAGPPLPKEERSIPLQHKLGLLRGLILPIFLIVAVMGSIFAGIATPSEAAGVGAVGAMIAAATRRQLTWQNLKLAVYDSLRTIAIVMWILFGAYAFVGVLSLAGGEQFIREIILGMGLGRWGTIILIQFILIIMGMLLDWVGILILMIPIAIPIVTGFGFSKIWFGVVFNVNMQIAYLSPPFGYSLFYLKGVAPSEITMADIYRSVLPFIGLQLIGLAVVLAFPQLSLWLPGMMIR
jgi:tripartite ATP-independent transporter DctM subunit